MAKSYKGFALEQSVERAYPFLFPTHRSNKSKLYSMKSSTVMKRRTNSGCFKRPVKQIIYMISITIGFWGCSHQPEKADTTKVTTEKKVDNSKYYTQLDTLLVTTEIGDTLQYSKVEFNEIVNNCPEFFNDYPENPDQAYYSGNGIEWFGGEAGKDHYYILYAYFLKQKNGVKNFAEQRQKLIDIYSHINSLFGQFEYGGTYFGHQKSRILGYAEYSIYLLPKEKDNISKTYDITKQKQLYIKSLRQLIEDESKIDFETSGKDKVDRIKELNSIIDELNMLITDNFYLRRAQEFHYGHYEYY